MQRILCSLRIRSVAVLLVTGATVVSAGWAATGPDLRQRAATLRAEEHAVLLQLYALNSRLDAARAELAGIRTRAGEIAREQAAARRTLETARKTLARAEHRLSRTLVAMYESERNDPLAVIFGAASLAELIGGLDNLTRVASSHAYVVDEAAAARKRIEAVRRSLRRRAAEARRIEVAAEAKAGELEQVSAERSAYLAGVRSESAAIADRIAAVEAQARAAQARAETVSAQAAVSGSIASFGAAPAPAEPEAQETLPVAAPALEEAAPIQAPASGARTMTVAVTAYSIKGTTSTGIPAGFGIVAVDPTVIPLGTRMTIPGYGEGVAADTGSGVRGAMIDVWLPSYAQAAAWGTKTVTITLH